VVAAVAHAAAIGVLLAIPAARPWRPPPVQFVTLPPLPETPPYLGAARPRGARPQGFAAPQPGPEPVIPPPPPPPVVPDTVAPAPPPAARGEMSLFEALQPRVGDGLAWVAPRPPLPADVAEAIYGAPENRDSVVARRLRAMVDSLNEVLDEERREHRQPSWTTQVAGSTFGIDSQYIHVAGIKIPTAALALLPIRLPEGNYDEQARSRHLQQMRDDIMQAAARTQNYQDFKRYVRELRARKEAEREAAKRRQQRPDTTKVVP
jgi:hypothetical protein